MISSKRIFNNKHFIIISFTHSLDGLGINLRELGEMKKELTAREQKVIHLRFGSEKDEVHTYEDIGKIFGVTCERIRQIENKALEKLIAIKESQAR